MPYLCQTLGKLVGVAGFEPATPSSRTSYPGAKPLIILESKWMKCVNKAGNGRHICAESVQTGARDYMRLLALLRVAEQQLPRLEPEDQAALAPASGGTWRG